MAKEKACKKCRRIFETSKCSFCEVSESVDNFRGKIYVLDPENSEIADQIGIKEKGLFAVRLR